MICNDSVSSVVGKFLFFRSHKLLIYASIILYNLVEYVVLLCILLALRSKLLNQSFSCAMQSKSLPFGFLEFPKVSSLISLLYQHQKFLLCRCIYGKKVSFMET